MAEPQTIRVPLDTPSMESNNSDLQAMVALSALMDHFQRQPDFKAAQQLRVASWFQEKYGRPVK